MPTTASKYEFEWMDKHHVVRMLASQFCPALMPYVLSHYGIAETYDNYVETTGTSIAGWCFAMRHIAQALSWVWTSSRPTEKKHVAKSGFSRK